MTPRIRIDLKAAPVEDADGVLYYDVSDPKTGSVLRLFDFEWILAQRLDGQHNFDELARFTEAELGFATSRADLEVYATKLRELGFMDPPFAVGERPVAPPPESIAPVAAPVAPPVAAKPIAAPLPEPPVAAPRLTPEPFRATDRPTPVGPGADSDDGLMGRPVIALPATKPAAAKPVAATATKTSGKPEPTSGKSALQEALAGLPEPEAEALPAQPKPEIKPEPKPEVKLPESVEKGAALNMAPTALLEQVVGPSTVKTGPLETIAAPSASTPIKPATPPSTTTPVKPLEQSTATPVKTSEPPKPVAVEPVKPKEPAAPLPVVEPIKLPETTSESGGSGKWIVIALVLLAVLGAAYYFLVYEPKLHPPAVAVQVSVAKVEDVPRLFPATADVKKPDPQTLKLESGGTVVTVAAENAEVTPDTALVVLDAQAKLDKELADVHTKIDQLQKKVDAAKGKAKQDTQAKLDERQARLGEVESLIKKAQLKPTRPGMVSKVFVKAGDVVAAGADAVAVIDKALVAELKVPALEAQGMKAGQEAKLSAGATTVNAQIVRATTEGEFATLVLSLPLDAAVKVGDKLSLQHGTLEKVVRVPATALLEGSKVYVVRDGKAVLQSITVADRDSDSVLLQGLANGDQIVVSHPPELHEGSMVQPTAIAAPAPAATAPAAPATTVPAAPAAPAPAAPAAPAPAAPAAK